MIHILTYLFKYLIVFPFLAIAYTAISITALLLWDKSYLVLATDIFNKINILMGID